MSSAGGGAREAPGPRDYCYEPGRFLDGNQVQLLCDGPEAFPSMLEAIACARHQVLLESYILLSDRTGQRFGERLFERARAGVDVRVIYDSAGSFGVDPAFFARLQGAGARVMEYHPVAPWRRRFAIWKRDHRKVLVVDGVVGFCGGLNVTDDCDVGASGRPWRDTHLRIEGPAVHGLWELFAECWDEHVDEAADRMPARPAPAPAVDGGVRVRVCGNRELRDRWQIRREILFALRAARRQLFVANPYFLPDPGILRALSLAARRGADVRVLLPRASDIPLIDLAARATFARLLRGGVRVYEWPDGMMHAKVLLADGLWSTVGSYNLDRRSLLHNLEVTAHVADPTFGAALAARFLSDFEQAREVRLEAFARRPVWRRLAEQLAYRLRAWL